MMYDGTSVHVIDAEVVGVKALSTMWCLLVVVELVWTWGMQQTVLERGNRVAMALAWQKVGLALSWHLLQQTVLEAGNGVAAALPWQKVELVLTQHLLQQRVLEVGKGVAVVMACQDVEWRVWGTLKLKQDTDWRPIH